MDDEQQPRRRKRVYLFELDSTRSTDEEIVRGQLALYHEIVTNGNVVVLTYNQLVDSRGFLSLLGDECYYLSLRALFEMGAIKVSQYGSTRTVVQYLINAIDKGGFIYTALPVKASQRRLTALMRRSLVYSDTEEMRRFAAVTEASPERDRAELRDLFTEVADDGLERPSTLSLEDMRGILSNLVGMVSFLINLSGDPSIYAHPRRRADYASGARLLGEGHIPDQGESGDLALVLSNILAQAIRLESPDDLGMPFAEAVGILRKVLAAGVSDDGVDKRSNLLTAIRRAWDGRERGRAAYSCAEAIVDVCYNYTCEISICDTSKHYDVGELRRADRPKTTFAPDFFMRLEELWDHGSNLEDRFLREDTNSFEPFEQFELIPSFDEAVRLTRFLPYEVADQGLAQAQDSDGNALVPRYEDGLDAQVASRRRGLRHAILRKIGIFLAYLVIALAFEYGLNILQGFYESQTISLLSPSDLLGLVPETVVFLIVGEFFPWLLGRLNVDIPSASESLGQIARLRKDARQLSGDAFPEHHVNEGLAAAELEDGEPRSEETQTGPVTSRALAAYRALRGHAAHEVAWQGYFADSDIYPLADVDDDSFDRIRRDEELHRRSYGVVYQSSYHLLVVDPIRRGDVSDGMGAFFPYERAIPTAVGGGVVVIALHEGRHVLINQFRHASRRDQLACVRGFSEAGCTPEDDVRRELAEEIGGVVAAGPWPLGSVEPDSGFQAGTATVWLVELESYGRLQAEEGVREVVELGEDDLVGKMARGEIDDGYTLAAYQLYRAWRTDGGGEDAGGA